MAENKLVGGQKMMACSSRDLDPSNPQGQKQQSSLKIPQGYRTNMEARIAKGEINKAGIHWLGN